MYVCICIYHPTSDDIDRSVIIRTYALLKKNSTNRVKVPVASVDIAVALTGIANGLDFAARDVDVASMISIAIVTVKRKITTIIRIMITYVDDKSLFVI
jgi:hypothetical protein